MCVVHEDGFVDNWHQTWQSPNERCFPLSMDLLEHGILMKDVRFYGILLIFFPRGHFLFQVWKGENTDMKTERTYTYMESRFLLCHANVSSYSLLTLNMLMYHIFSLSVDSSMFSCSFRMCYCVSLCDIKMRYFFCFQGYFGCDWYYLRSPVGGGKS